MRDWTIATQPDRRARLQFIRARERVDALRRQVVVLAVGWSEAIEFVVFCPGTVLTSGEVGY